ncbi:MAG: hypothetical protein H0U69_12915 [Trueperaceae bacterium]|nr:hypothetical protein [Trueperaceae bacterium]
MIPDAARLIADALALRADAFLDTLELGRPGLRLGLMVVFLAGLSTAIGQSVTLFAHRVSPRRFAASLLVQALLFVVGFLAWVAATWVVGGTIFDRPRPVVLAFATVGLAHAPQLFGFFVLTPYFGTPIGTVLSVWTLLASVLATAAVFDLTLVEAATCAGLGWLASQLLQRTIGRPIIWIGRAVRRSVAGVDVRTRPLP